MKINSSVLFRLVWVALVASVFFLSGPSLLWSGSLDDVEEQSEETKKYLSTLNPDAIVQKQSLSLHIYFFGKRTTEEGFHGVLYKNGHEVIAKTPLTSNGRRRRRSE